jgi:hypothetical protein
VIAVFGSSAVAAGSDGFRRSRSATSARVGTCGGGLRTRAKQTIANAPVTAATNHR